MTDQELAIAIPTAFPELFPAVRKHNSKPRPNKCCGLYCTKCKVEFTKQNGELNKPCTVPDPIDINWDNAMKVFRDTGSERPIKEQYDYQQRFQQAMRDVHADQTSAEATPEWEEEMTEWFLLLATPADYLRAALKAKKINKKT